MRLHRPEPRRHQPLNITLYRKPGCGLCDEAAAMLSRISREIPIQLTAIDIDSDEDLQRRYFLEIPVIVAGEREVARAPISERALKAALRDLLIGGQ